MLLTSFVITIVVSAVLGLITSHDQPYAPLPSDTALAIVFAASVGCGGFVGYSYYNYMRLAKIAKAKLARSIYIGVGIAIAILLFAHFIRMISV